MTNANANVNEVILNLISSGSIYPGFQPLYESGGALLGYEALARINGPSPFLNVEEMFSAAMGARCIEPLDMHCRSRAITEASKQGLAASDALLFVNVCPEVLQYPSHRYGVTDTLASDAGFERSRIVLEITENSAIKNWALFEKAVTIYRGRGYKIAIDDFGSGYGGLKMLSVVRPDFIKIDKHFISSIFRESVNYQIIEAMVAVCRKLNIKVVAEGIENVSEMLLSIELGADYMQGYFLGRPETSIYANDSESVSIRSALHGL